MRLIAAILLFLVPVSTLASDKHPFATVQALFAEMSEFDFDGMRALVTHDFVILEVGELWDMDKTEAVIAPLEGTLTRRNFFSLIRSETMGDMAWVSYWNRAIYTSDEGVRERAWLESAVLVADGAGWKIQMLHSTRLDDGLPEGVDAKEYPAEVEAGGG